MSSLLRLPTNAFADNKQANKSFLVHDLLFLFMHKQNHEFQECQAMKIHWSIVGYGDIETGGKSEAK